MRWSIALARRGPEAVLILTLTAAAPAAAELAYVTCQNGEELSVLDLDTGQEAARWPVPGKPAGVAVTTAGNIYTVSPDSKTVRRMSTATGTVLASAVLDGGPIGAAYDPARNRLFVSDWYNARVWALDGDTLAHTAELQTGAAPAGLALSGDGQYLASADRDANQVSIFDAGTLGLLYRVPVGERPFGLRFAPDGRLFVANVGTNDLSIVDAALGRITATVPVGDRPYGVAFASGRAFVTNQYEDTVSVIALDGLTDEGKIDVGEYPEGIDATADGSAVAVANWFDNTITVIDAHSLSVLRQADTCDGPRAFGRFLLGGGNQ